MHPAATKPRRIKAPYSASQDPIRPLGRKRIGWIIGFLAEELKAKRPSPHGKLDLCRREPPGVTPKSRGRRGRAKNPATLLQAYANILLTRVLGPVVASSLELCGPERSLERPDSLVKASGTAFHHVLRLLVLTGTRAPLKCNAPQTKNMGRPVQKDVREDPNRIAQPERIAVEVKKRLVAGVQGVTRARSRGGAPREEQICETDCVG